MHSNYETMGNLKSNVSTIILDNQHDIGIDIDWTNKPYFLKELSAKWERMQLYIMIQLNLRVIRLELANFP
jgi:hypothetical protein